VDASFFELSARPPVCYLTTVRHHLPNLHVIRGLMGCCFLLADGDQSVMLDTGLVGETYFIRRKLRQLGLPPQAIKTILLTHGHLDHAGNLARLQRWTGAKILAHPAEQVHINGTYSYQGVNRWCGRLEAFGRAVLNYHPAAIDEFLADDQMLPLWGGLRVIHLPGHTLGHCGFYSEKLNLLFCGDMMASYFFSTHRPSPIFNSAPELFAASAEKIRRLKPRWILPCHFDRLDPDRFRRGFAKLYGFDDWETVSSRPV
jgi:glyoxylase-like metal-dependent hydrolase (beta-lactamase superfamily II)